MNCSKILWIAVKTIAVLACGLRGAGAVADAENPNIIFIFSDDEGRLVPDGVPDPAKATHSENLFQREAVALIRRNRDRPFFLYYATQLPLPTLLGKPDQQRDHAYLCWENGSRSPHAQSARRDLWWAFRTHPAEPVQLYRLDRDPACERDVAGDHPDVVEQFLAIFNEARVPSEWYVNPGEGKDQVAAKRQRAQAANGMQVPVGPNTRRSPW